MNRKYTWRPGLHDIRDHLYARAVPIESLPAKMDLRPGCPPVYDQGDLGSCTANAAAGAFEFDLKRQGLIDFEPSRLFIYYNERIIDGDVRTDAGSQLRTAAKTLNKDGVCAEADWPYDVSKFAKKPAAACYTKAKKNVSTSYQSLDNTNITQLKTCLASGAPFILGISVYDSFESDAVAKGGNVPMPAAHESLLGGHAVMCVGYDDTKQVFIVRNSWGADWGDGGYCYMPYAYLTNHKLASDFWKIAAVV